MNCKSALAILGGFSLAALLASIWGIRDIAASLTAMSYCENPVQIDLSAFWFVGALSISGLPLLSVFHTEKAHKIIFGILIFWFIAAPLASHRYFLAQGNSAGYDIAPASSVFKLDRVVLSELSCAP